MEGRSANTDFADRRSFLVTAVTVTAVAAVSAAAGAVRAVQRRNHLAVQTLYFVIVNLGCGVWVLALQEVVR